MYVRYNEEQAKHRSSWKIIGVVVMLVLNVGPNDHVVQLLTINSIVLKTILI